MALNASAETLLTLLRGALCGTGEAPLPKEAKWDEVYHLAAGQGVMGVAADGLGQCLSDSNEDLYYSWLGQVMLQEQEYEAQKRAMVDLAGFYDRQDIGMMVLKGYGLSLNYPIPEHRPVGDIDIWLFEKASVDKEAAWKRADEALERELGIGVDASHEHHTMFMFEGCMVENHYDIINTKETRSAKGIDATLKRLAKVGFRTAEGIYLPSATFNAIFLIRHMGQHMAGEKVALRHLLDWGLFLREAERQRSASPDERLAKNDWACIDWEFVLPYWKAMGIDRFARAVNTVCVRYLGFDKSIFHGALMDGDDPLVARLMNDILSPEFQTERPAGGILRTSLWKTRRFFANGWKRRLVYKEGLVESFVTGSVSKVIRNDYQ